VLEASSDALIGNLKT